MGVAAALRISSDLAEGLEALWSAGVVHRDMKPANVLLDPKQVAYITDFGLAKETQGTRLTIMGGALGSMDYMGRTDPRRGGDAGRRHLRARVRHVRMLGRPPTVF